MRTPGRHADLRDASPSPRRLARERAPSLKVVLASGYGRSALPDGDRIREHTVLLPKPYAPEAMAQALRRACSDG